MLSFAPAYDHLPLIAKVEVFEYALQNTEGNDLARVCIFHLCFFLLSICSLFFPLEYFSKWYLFLGSLVKKSHLRGVVRQEDKLYKKLGCHEYGMFPLLVFLSLHNPPTPPYPNTPQNHLHLFYFFVLCHLKCFICLRLVTFLV